jgi:dTDP-4-dehydrorhamnose reductase
LKILLLGAAGQVGTELRRSLAGLGDLVPATRDGKLPDGAACEAADFDAPESLRPLILRTMTDVVVNAAAYTAVDRAESEPEAAFRANAEAPAVLADACKACDALFVHYSTDYVFDGAGTRPYREDDPTAPLGVYGASKLAGEEAVRSSGARHLILRTAWVYAAHGSNFLLTMLRLARERDRLKVVADQQGSPTSAGVIADITARILKQGITQSGIRHLTTSGQTSWHGFAEAIFAAAIARGVLERAPVVDPIATSDYPTPARRPAFSVLDNRRLQAEYAIELPDWRDGLDRVIAELAPTG